MKCFADLSRNIYLFSFFRKLKIAERIAGNANNVLQPRFSKTRKKTGRPRKTPQRKPTEE